MSDRDALLRAILAHPADQLPRLVFADYLDETGEPERAAFIRFSCELDRAADEQNEKGFRNWLRRVRAKRELEAFAQHAAAWLAPGVAIDDVITGTAARHPYAMCREEPFSVYSYWGGGFVRVAAVHGVVGDAVQRMLNTHPVEEFHWEMFFPRSVTRIPVLKIPSHVGLVHINWRLPPPVETLAVVAEEADQFVSSFEMAEGTDARLVLAGNTATREALRILRSRFGDRVFGPNIAA